MRSGPVVLTLTPVNSSVLTHRRIALAFIALPLLLASCAPAEQAASTADTSAVTVARQPIPDGVDPRMVTWRGDGLLVPRPDSLQRIPGYVVDSVFSPEEGLRRFQATVRAPRPARFAGGAADQETLLRNYWTALVRHDTLAIRELVVSHAEFAYLYLPESAPFAAGMHPSAAWILYESATGRGLSRAFREATSRAAASSSSTSRDGAITATICRDQGRDEGKSHTFGPCGVVLRAAQSTDTLWIAATLVRRDGVVKFLGLDNAL